MTNTPKPIPFSDQDLDGMADWEAEMDAHDETSGWWDDAHLAQWDDDPSPYDGNYSEM